LLVDLQLERAPQATRWRKTVSVQSTRLYLPFNYKMGYVISLMLLQTFLALSLGVRSCLRYRIVEICTSKAYTLETDILVYGKVANASLHN